MLGRPLSGAPLPCLWHQPPRVCILCILHSGTDIGELGEAEEPKRQMERGHTEGWTGCMRAWWQMLQRVWQLQQQVMMGARDGDGSAVKPPGGLGCSHIRAFLPFLHRRWAGTAAVLSWSWPGVGWGCGCLGFHTAAFLLQSGEQLCPLLPSCFVFYMTGSGPASLCPMGLPLCRLLTQILGCRGVGRATGAREVSIQVGGLQNNGRV